MTVWLVFEAFNLVLKNWGYVGVIANPWVRWPGYALAFATVLPGVLLAAEVLAALGAWRGAAGPARQVALCLGARGPAAGDAPSWSCPWSFPVMPSPWCGGPFSFSWTPSVKLLGGPFPHPGLARRRAPGTPLPADRRACLRPLVGGLELWATAKWVYTLPVLNFGKVFEMPVLGYLGFLPFALECAVMYNFMKALDERVLVTPRRCRYAIVIQLAFWLVDVCGPGCLDGDFLSVSDGVARLCLCRLALSLRMQSMKVMAFNGSPRRTWNTATLLTSLREPPRGRNRTHT